MSLFHFIGRNDNAVFIVDPGIPGQMSVTNAAEVVVKQCFKAWGDRRIIYRDSEGRWSELVHIEDRFTRFGELSEQENQKWQEWLLPIGESV